MGMSWRYVLGNNVPQDIHPGHIPTTYAEDRVCSRTYKNFLTLPGHIPRAQDIPPLLPRTRGGGVLGICPGGICPRGMVWRYVLGYVLGNIERMSWRYILEVCRGQNQDMSWAHWTYVLRVCRQDMSCRYVVERIEPMSWGYVVEICRGQNPDMSWVPLNVCPGDMSWGYVLGVRPGEQPQLRPCPRTYPQDIS